MAMKVLKHICKMTLYEMENVEISENWKQIFVEVRMHGFDENTLTTTMFVTKAMMNQ